MNLLLVNDDGIHAPGLTALERAVQGFGQAVTVAPDKHFSGCGHQATTHRPLRLTEAGPRRFMLDGTPADCTRVGLTHVADDIDWVVAGINEGGNLGADVYMSGTVAAAREAAFLGKPAIAISHYVRRSQNIDWGQAANWAAIVLQRIFSQATEKRPAVGTYWNVNLPHCEPGAPFPDIVDCPLDGNAMPVAFELHEGLLHYRGNYHQRQRTAGHDVDVCFSGRIAITRLML
ncbi:MAG: 5'/3'-nucleotidase SurE [Pirellulales bacterium]